MESKRHKLAVQKYYKQHAQEIKRKICVAKEKVRRKVIFQTRAYQKCAMLGVHFRLMSQMS